jgi:hypothetical protein
MQRKSPTEAISISLTSLLLPHPFAAAGINNIPGFCGGFLNNNRGRKIKQLSKLWVRLDPRGSARFAVSNPVPARRSRVFNVAGAKKSIIVGLTVKDSPGRRTKRNANQPQ